MNFLEELEKLKDKAKDAWAIWSLFPSIISIHQKMLQLPLDEFSLGACEQLVDG